MRIEFRKQRDFGAKFNATFEYLRQEFKPLMKALLYIAGPIILIQSVATAYYQRFSLNLFDFTFEDPVELINDDFFGTLVLLMLSSIAAYIFLIGIINEYVKGYVENGGQSLDVTAVWERTRKVLGNYAISMVFYLFLLVVFGAFLGLAFFTITTLGSTFLDVFVGIGMAILVVMASVLLYLLVIVYNTESHGMLQAIGRSVELIRGKWLSTIGLLFVASLVASIAGFVFSLPNTILATIGVLHSMEDGQAVDYTMTETLVFGITSVISTAGNFLLASIPVLALIFQYHNLVERHDSTGLMSRIENIGSGVEQVEDEEY